ncbi:TetR/AcrR family transcriptional regulator [Pseudanabaena sp. PCC 6802]|uniref:TetR/AcrR family transcriptional regulator n=1 Tax=Pseudanabaena sp. PCC 6802 TaxID=118173 RepID=UPI000344ECCC|nr:TetR/AcrR family transcriptional regulator [Pseudanabaena sp. PCC 6802]
MPKIVDRDRYRKELLDRSFDLFAEKGYGSITMRQIAQGLGVSTGTLYHYFPSKEALFVQLVEELTARDISTFLAEADWVQGLSERIAALVNFVAKYEDYFSKQTILFLDFYQQQDRTKIENNEILARSWGQTKQAIAGYLQIPNMTIVDFILTFLNGLIVGRLCEGDRLSFEEQGAILKEMLANYLDKSLVAV